MSSLRNLSFLICYYSIVPTDEEVAALPHVCRDKLDLTQFLGSGAFGEVYEGVAHDILDNGSEPVKCAVKVSQIVQLKFILNVPKVPH